MSSAFSPTARSRIRYAGWLAPWCVGLMWRLVAAASGFGWFAIDDYLFVIEKAALWLDAPDAPFDCDYRSTLIPRLFAKMLALGHAWAGSDPADALQVAYACLGVLSTGSIIAVYYTARLGAGPRAARMSAWLCATYVIMPRICTRALLESCAMLPVALSVWALAYATHPPAGKAAPKRLWAALFCGASAALCGLGAMMRFQVGILALPMGLWAMMPNAQRKHASISRTLGYVAGGVAALCAQAAMDMHAGRSPLSTPWAYVRYNLQHASRYGVSPVYTYVLQCLMLALPPACLLLGYKAWRTAVTKQRVVFVLVVFFIGCHSLIAHKEDRFLFPILPLLFVLMGTALAADVPDGRWQKRLFVGGRRLFWGVNCAGLLIASLSDAQRNWTMPLLLIARTTPRGETRHLVVIEPDVVPSYYLAKRATWRGYADMPTFYAAQTRISAPLDYVLVRTMPDAQGQAMLAELGCGQPRRFEGDFVDKVLVGVNRHNLRRAATTLFFCTKPTPVPTPNYTGASGV